MTRTEQVGTLRGCEPGRRRTLGMESAWHWLGTSTLDLVVAPFYILIRFRPLYPQPLQRA